MKTREFGDTGIMVGEIALGCGGLSAHRRQEFEEVLSFAFDHGVNCFDTADMYGGGSSEEILGDIFHNRRDQVVYATKWGSPLDADGKHTDKVTEEHLRQSVEGSLKRLRTDYIDIYMYHTPPTQVIENQMVFEVMDKFVEEGKIRCYGASLDRGEDAVGLLDRTHSKDIEMILGLFNQGAREPFLSAAAERGAGVLVKVPLAGGTLTGRFSNDYPPRGEGRRKRWGEQEFTRRLELVERVRTILEKPGRTMGQGALAWLLTVNPGLVPIPGITSLEKVKENIGAGGMRLADDEMKALDELEGGLIRNLRLKW